MKTLLKPLGAILALAALSPVASAEVTPRQVTYSFAIPQGIDPPVVIDLTALNMTQGFTGADLLDHGVEIHGQIPGSAPSSYRDILEVQFLLYTGGESYSLGVNTVAPWNAWNISAMQAMDPNYEQVTLTAANGSAPINDHFPLAPGINDSFLVFNATATGDPAFLTALRNSTVAVQATKEGVTDRLAPVPEPGIVGVTLALLCATGGCLTRRRAR